MTEPSREFGLFGGEEPGLRWRYCRERVRWEQSGVVVAVNREGDVGVDPG